MTDKSKKSKKSNTSQVKEIAEKLFSLMGANVELEVVEDKENEAILVNVNTDSESGLLIGSRGETLNSIQAIIGMIYRQTTGEWVRILLNIADWREKQEERLISLAEQTAERVRSSGEPQPLYNLTASERRMVHLTLAKHKDIETESVGEEDERCLVVKLKK